MAGLIAFPDISEPLLNVDFSVGPHRANKPDDVRLVQALFNTIILGDPDGLITGSPFRKKMVSLTGTAGPKTRALIRDYQAEVQRRPKPDGIISRCPGGANTAIAALDFTIISLSVNASEILRRSPFLSGGASLVDFIRNSVPALRPFLVPREADGFTVGGESLSGASANDTTGFSFFPPANAN